MDGLVGWGLRFRGNPLAVLAHVFGGLGSKSVFHRRRWFRGAVFALWGQNRFFIGGGCFVVLFLVADVAGALLGLAEAVLMCGLVGWCWGGFSRLNLFVEFSCSFLRLADLGGGEFLSQVGDGFLNGFGEFFLLFTGFG